jgi:hypothetical protein
LASVNLSPLNDTFPRGTLRTIDVMVLIGRSISTTASHSIVAPDRRNDAVRRPASFICPPAHTKPSQMSLSESPFPSTFIFDWSSP